MIISVGISEKGYYLNNVTPNCQFDLYPRQK